MSMTELIFIRHGETDWNRARRFQGCIDIALNATGLEQARHTADRLQDHRLAAVYSSHLGRARETARPIAEALGLAVAIEPELRERSYGAFEGQTHDELLRNHPEAYQRWRDRVPDYELPGGGESLVALRARVRADAPAREAPRGTDCGGGDPRRRARFNLPHCLGAGRR